jgi:hypothetical protein
MKNGAHVFLIPIFKDSDLIETLVANMEAEPSLSQSNSHIKGFAMVPRRTCSFEMGLQLRVSHGESLWE